MAEEDAFHARRSAGQESTTVPMTEVYMEGNNQNTYANPFLEEQSRPRNYNVSIPAVEQWPRIAAKSFDAFAKHSVRLWQGIRAKWSEDNYQALPSSSSSSFGQRKKKEAGRTTLLGRQMTRILALFFIVGIVLTWAFLPATVKPFQKRDIWIRYFNHEEPIKIVLPYSLKVDVYDVKKAAMKELFQGYSMVGPSEVKLINLYGALESDMMTFLNSSLGCFSGIDKFNYRYETVRFQSYNYGRLYKILSHLGGGKGSKYYIQKNDIHFLREAFNDPLKDQAPSNNDSYELWERPAEVKRRPHWIEPYREIPEDRGIPVDWISPTGYIDHDL
ncbi:hypothetical protein BGZ76_011823 [Entomortierella beljakovae]|nr:hypothetical protein BGZ76_011823 [Entomortierella beljakovae]